MDFTSARGVYVVLDATELHRDWFLAGLEFRMLRFFIREAGMNVVLPPSVFAEVVTNHRREYSKARRELAKAAGYFRRVAGRGTLSVSDLPDASDYEEWLVERLESFGIDLLPWPQAPHEYIARRASERRPPFDEAGSGYRDTLVWLSCLELATAGRTVFLVSQDKDFIGRDQALAEALVEEVIDLEGSVTLVRQLGPWLLPLVPWRDVRDLKQAAANAQDEEVASMFVPWDRFEDPQLTAKELGVPPSAAIEDITYYGSGVLERVSHAKSDDGSYKVTYTFPIQFEVLMTLETDEARAYGYIDHEGSITGCESVRTVIPMIGEMTVVHDETLADLPYYVDSCSFQPISQSSLLETGADETSAQERRQQPLPFEADDFGGA